MSDHRNPRPSLPKPPSPDNPDPDPRPHVAALLELSVLGWRVTDIRPDFSEPVLWRVTVARYDGNASIAVTDPDPDEALDELVRYASADAEEARASVAALETGESAAGSAEPEVRAQVVAELEALGWELLDDPRRTSTGWRAAVRRGSVSMFAYVSTEQEALEDLLRQAWARAKEGR